MDDEFYKERARHMRALATEADPFIKKRLLCLASHYEAIITRPKVAVLNNLTDPSADSFAKSDRSQER
jgi:hypothetical protein